MYAIVDIAGKQYKVEANNYVYTPKLNSNKGDTLTFDSVLLNSDGEGNVSVGTPTTGNIVTATVVEHVKAGKITVFKKKRRKGYKVKNGHRQDYTKIFIEQIN